MRFYVQLLDTAATLNRFTKKTQVEISQGETVNLYFQLLDLDQQIRYMPSNSATVYVEIARFPEAFPTISNVRTVNNYSVRRFASMAFPSDDRSIWVLPLTSIDTSTMTSTNVRFTLTDGSTVAIAVVTMAIQVTRSEGC